MIGTNKLNKGHLYHYYICQSRSNHRDCSNRSIPTDEIDAAVWEQLMIRVKQHQVVSLTQSPAESDISADLEKHRQELVKRQLALIKWISDGTVPIELTGDELKKIARKLTAINSTIAAQTNRHTAKRVSPCELINAANFEKQRQILLQFGVYIHAFRDKAGDISIDIRS